jgi:site-specific recombinase XerD
MMKVKDAQFFTVVSSFLNVYLVKNRSCSSNTVKSYEDALNLLFTFLEGTKDIPRQRVSWSISPAKTYRNSWTGWRKSGTAVDKHSCKGLPQYALLCGMAAL